MLRSACRIFVASAARTRLFHTSYVVAQAATKKRPEDFGAIASNQIGVPSRASNQFFDDVLAASGVMPSSSSVDSALSDGTGFVLASGEVLKGSALIINNVPFLWDVTLSESATRTGVLDLPKDAFAVLELCHPKPELIMIGTGARTLMLSKETRQRLYDLGISVDVMDSRNAASTFNMLLAEGRKVAAGLLSAKRIDSKSGKEL